MTVETRPPTVCKVCAAPLHYTADGSGREWVWLDDDGRASHERYPFNPYERLNELAAAKTPRAIEEYSRLLVDLDFGGMFAMHRPVDNGPWRPSDPAPADHCGQPPYYSPTGWECRKCKTAL